MTRATFSDLEKRITRSLKEQNEALKNQKQFAISQYKIACENYGNTSNEAGRWDKIACAVSYAIEALNAI